MVTENLLARRVRAGDELGLNVYHYDLTDGSVVAPHLHLEAFYRSPGANERLRLNPLLFFATTAPGIELFYTPRTGMPEDDQPYDYYPVDNITDTGQVSAFEWPAYDTNDPGARDFDYSETEDDYDREDYDLAMPMEANNEWAVVGDIPGSVTTNPWDRIRDQNGSPSGLQDITNSNIEWPARERMILSISDLIAAFRNLVP